jgi:peptide/nickel transport system ATP-binding protein
MKLMQSLAEQMGVTYLYITHDLAVARYMSNRLAVMYLGKIVEMGEIEELLINPLHPYTKALLAAIPVPKLTQRIKKIEIIKGEVTSPVNPKPGCRFASRCPLFTDKCLEPQEFKEVSEKHFVACHLLTSSRVG